MPDDTLYPQDQPTDDAPLQEDDGLQETLSDDDELLGEDEDVVAEPVDDEEDLVGGGSVGEDGAEVNDEDDVSEANAFEDDEETSLHP